jgi:hypothetical protein
MADAHFRGGPLDGRTLNLPVERGHFVTHFTHHAFTGVKGTGYVKHHYQLTGVTDGAASYAHEGQDDESVLRTVRSED